MDSVFGRLTVVEKTNQRHIVAVLWRCVCDYIGPHINNGRIIIEMSKFLNRINSKVAEYNDELNGVHRMAELNRIEEQLKALCTEARRYEIVARRERMHNV